MPLQRVDITFTSDEFTANYTEDLFQVISFEGVEAISEPYRFDIELISDEQDIDLTTLIGKNATLNISRDLNSRQIHGVIFRLEQGEETQFGQYSYKAVLVPRLYLMSLSRQNRIYQEMSIPEIVKEAIITSHSPGVSAADNIVDRLDGTYNFIEYLVQYNESDLNFISRLLEGAGIYYFFEHDGEQENLILCDDISRLEAVKDENKLPQVPKSGLAAFENESIHSFRLKQLQVSAEVVLKDFDFERPNLDLSTPSQQVSSLGHGRLYNYGENYQDEDVGINIALLRSQAELCKEKTGGGVSNGIFIEAGKLITMRDHYRDDLNGDYTIIKVRHSGRQAISGVTSNTSMPVVDAVDLNTAYQNSFDAIPSDIAFRPPIVATKPKLVGIMTGIIDGAIDSNRAQIDAQGRYKMIFPFDLSTKATDKNATASCWIRKAETYGGQGTGSHYPLLKGTEVIWTCINGDPDRPIITGVVYNPLNANVVTSANHTRNVTKTASGITTITDDGDGTAAGKKMHSIVVPDYDGFGTNAYLRMGYPDNSAPEIEAGTNGSDEGAGIVMSTRGSIKQKSHKNYFSQTSGISFKQDLSASASYAASYSAQLSAAGTCKVDTTFGLGIGLGFSTKMTAGTDVSINYGVKFSAGSTREFKNVSGPLVQQARSVLFRASDFDGPVSKTDMALGVGTVLAGMTAATTAIAAVPGTDTIDDGTWSDPTTNKALLLASGISSAATVAGSVAYALRKIKHEENELKNAAGKESFIAMDNDSLVLSCDGSSIVINAEGVFINGKTFALGQLPKKADEFKPKEADLANAKVGRIYPDYVNLNATKTIDIRSKQDIVIVSNPSLKMEDNIVAGVLKKKMKPKEMDPAPRDKGGAVKIDKKGNVKTFAEGDKTIVSKKNTKIIADGKMTIVTKKATFTKDVLVKGLMKDKNWKSS